MMPVIELAVRKRAADMAQRWYASLKAARDSGAKVHRYDEDLSQVLHKLDARLFGPAQRNEVSEITLTWVTDWLHIRCATADAYGLHAGIPYWALEMLANTPVFPTMDMAVSWLATRMDPEWTYDMLQDESFSAEPYALTLLYQGIREKKEVAKKRDCAASKNTLGSLWRDVLAKDRHATVLAFEQMLMDQVQAQSKA